MLGFAHRSLLIQLLSGYLLFVLLVLFAGIGVNLAMEQRLRTDAQVSDQALAQDIALETSTRIQDAEASLISLSGLLAQARSTEGKALLLQTFQKMRGDVDHVSWLDPVGDLLLSWPPDQINTGVEFSPPGVIQRARLARNPVFEVGIAVETAFNAGVIIAEPVRLPDQTLMGIVVANISLVELSKPLITVVQAQHQLGRSLMISIIDERGELVATPDHRRILQTVTDELPGAEQALQNQVASRVNTGNDGENWLYSAVPVPAIGWAVIVQRPVSEALAVIVQFHFWLLTVALLFAIGGLFFWLILLLRFIQPLHQLAVQHQVLPASEQAIPFQATLLSKRQDEVGALARAFIRLERDGLRKLGELRTLLTTSNAVVSSLEPHAVVRKIIQEVQQLVNVQAAAVLLPDEEGILRVLVSEGHSERYNQVLSLPPENVSSSAVQALRDQQPVQKLLSQQDPWPSYSYDEGFHTALAIPIISRHVGNVVLLVHRIEARLFEQNEIDLLLMFANYATLAWEHALLYERSDVRLREVAGENERLYRQASEEKQKLAAIIGSMSDGLVLTGNDGTILYSNTGASTLVGLTSEALAGRSISVIYGALSAAAINAAHSELLALQENREELVVEIRQGEGHRALQIRQFDVGNQSGRIGQGLLLRDITREREMDAFKTTLLAAVGHELRTPLAAIKGHASTLLQEDVTWSPEEQHHFLQTISNEADRLALLVRNILDLSRQEAGLLLLNYAPTKIQELITTIVERLQPPDIHFMLQIPAQLPAVALDRARMEVVLYNLIANALLYGDGEVRITATQQHETLIIAVADNGPGIESEEMPHVFERFYRTQRGLQKRSGGTGLGLTICKAFIEAHKGAIWVESNGAGTTFSFSLPLVPSGPSLSNAGKHKSINGIPSALK